MAIAIGDRGDQPRDAADLSLEWAGLCLDALGESGDPSQLGVHPGREHDTLSLASGGARAAEEEIACGEPWHARVLQLGGAQRGHRLARQRGEIDLERAGEQAHVGGDAIALLEHHNVAGYESGGLDDAAAPSRSTVACWGM